MRISASFDTFDQAENCARTLKHTCEGIQAIRIRRRTPGEQDAPIGDPPAQVVPFAFFNGTVPNGFPQQGFAPGMLALDFEMDGDLLPEKDGPGRRQDCRMDILAEPYAAHQIEQTILNEHGRHLGKAQL